MRVLIIVALAAPALAGCVSTVKSVVTAPVKAVGQVADWSTTSQDEADRQARGENVISSQFEEERIAADQAAADLLEGGAGQLAQEFTSAEA